MPHCVIEYSSSLDDVITGDDLCLVVHKASLENGNFSKIDIKVRAIAYESYLVGGVKDDFLHVTISLLDGRTDETKKALTEDVLNSLKQLKLPVKCLSVYADDIIRSVYSKIQ